MNETITRTLDATVRFRLQSTFPAEIDTGEENAGDPAALRLALEVLFQQVVQSGDIDDIPVIDVESVAVSTVRN